MPITQSSTTVEDHQDVEPTDISLMILFRQRISEMILSRDISSVNTVLDSMASLNIEHGYVFEKATIKHLYLDHPEHDFPQSAQILQDDGFALFPSLAVNFGHTDQLAITYRAVSECCEAVIVGRNGPEFEVRIFGTPTTLSYYTKLFTDRYHTDQTVLKTVSTDARGELEIGISVLNSDCAKFARSSFYPYFNISIKAYFDAYIASPEPILFLFGAPGTGKSTFIRSMLHTHHQKAMLCYTEDAITHKRLFGEFVAEEDTAFLVLEDADLYVTSRLLQENKFIQNLLNFTDGIAGQLGKKIVISTNLPSLDRVDGALLRVGRCFDILEFQELTADAASRIRFDLGLSERDFSRKKTWTLAEIVSEDNPARRQPNRFNQTFGFR